MTLSVRPVERSDISAVAELNRVYMRESYKTEWKGSEEALMRDIFVAPQIHVVVAERDGEVVGFAAWYPSYDIHHCVPGGTLSDLYMLRGDRGQGAAVFLLARVAEDVLEAGGSYLKGTSLPGSPARLYARLAKGRQATEFNLASPWLDRLAEADNWKDLTALMQSIPRKTG